MKKLEKFLEIFMRLNGVAFSWMMPIMAFILALGLWAYMFSAPTWKATTLLFFMGLFFFFIGSFLFIKRKSLWKEDLSPQE